MLYVTLPQKLTIGPLWLFPLLVLGLLVPLSIFSPNRVAETNRARIGSIALIAILTAYNIVSVYLLVHSLIHPDSAHPKTGGELLVAGVHFDFWYVVLGVRCGRSGGAREVAECCCLSKSGFSISPDDECRRRARHGG